MKKFLFSAIIISFSLSASAQLPGGSDIWLFDMNESKTFSFTSGTNITKDNDGYDNQPAFAPGGEYLLFSSARKSSQTDIYKYDIRKQTTTQFCNTPETSEFSPSFVPGNKYISTVVVEKDSAQRLWRYNLNGSSPEVMFSEIDSVGYHCWFDEDKVFFFVLTQPFSLVETDLKSKKPVTVAKNIGRSMQTYNSPQRKLMLYSQVIDSTATKIKALNSDGEKQKEFEPIKLLDESQDFVVTKSGKILMASGAKIYSWEIGQSVTWKEEADLSSFGLKNITRIAISKTGTKIALVDNPAKN